MIATFADNDAVTIPACHTDIEWYARLVSDAAREVAPSSVSRRLCTVPHETGRRSDGASNGEGVGEDRVEIATPFSRAFQRLPLGSVGLLRSLLEV